MESLLSHMSTRLTRNMSRRRFLGAAVSAVGVGIAGCGEDDVDSGLEDGGEGDGGGGNGGGDAGDTATDADDAPGDAGETETETEAEGADFQVREIDHPEELEVGEAGQYSITVENVGEADGSWEDTLEARIEDDAQTKDIALDVPAGETETWTSGEVSSPYQTVVRYRLQDAGEEFSIAYVAARLAYGESFTNPDDMEMAVRGVDFSQSYEWSSGDYEYTEESDDGMQYAWVDVRVENVGTQSNHTPFEGDITIIAGNRQYDSEYVSKDEGRYESGEIAPDIVREGWIAYQIPEDLSNGDFVVTYTDSDYSGEWTARWSA